jgi:hypothetical protein
MTDGDEWMNLDVIVRVDATDTICAMPQRIFDDGIDSPRVVLTVGDVALHLPRAIAAEVERKIATALESFR